MGTDGETVSADSLPSTRLNEDSDDDIYIYIYIYRKRERGGEEVNHVKNNNCKLNDFADYCRDF